MDSGVGEQPLDMETIVKGSKTRAENAMRLSVDGGDKAMIAIGIESGLYQILHHPTSTQVGLILVCVQYTMALHTT